ncbi:MAG: F0F1 ATP synthase subunit beta, partial [Bacillota bacterium]|nr:F0F1 ATP synthase subunit beta [Bacillota bacterium]
MNNIGKIVRIIGPVLDIRFADVLPQINEAINIKHGDISVVAEVAQHVGDNVVRAIAMSS